MNREVLEIERKKCQVRTCTKVNAISQDRDVLPMSQSNNLNCSMRKVWRQICESSKLSCYYDSKVNSNVTQKHISNLLFVSKL